MATAPPHTCIEDRGQLPTHVTVSVLVMTYNHAAFIRQALDSVLNQAVPFAYEILISEDCSTDGTRDIVLDYWRQRPDRIRLLLSERNCRSNEIVARGVRAARGQYIALLDGDDYWISKDKLQKQVTFLDHHPECAVCFHNARVIHEGEQREPHLWNPDHQKPRTTLEDMLKGNFIATGSTMFRAGLFEDFPDWYFSMFPITDWALHILNAKHGDIGYIPDTMSVYRHHAGGEYSSLDQLKKLETNAKCYQILNAGLDFKYDATIRRGWFRYFLGWVAAFEGRGQYEAAKICFRKYLLGHRPPGRAALVCTLRAGAKLYLSPSHLTRTLLTRYPSDR